jgi:hypothetical protein
VAAADAAGGEEKERKEKELSHGYLQTGDPALSTGRKRGQGVALTLPGGGAWLLA